MKKNNYLASIWTNVYEEDGAAATAEAEAKAAEEAKATEDAKTAEATAAAAAAAEAATFKQADVDRIVRSRLREHEKESKKMLTEMNALRARADLTSEERQDWEKRVTQLNDTLLSKEELAHKAAQKAALDHEEKVTNMTQEIETWKTRFTQSTIQRSLQDAAIQHKSFYPEQIVSILDRDTRLVEELVDGKPTGRLVPRVRFADTDSEGKPKTLELSPQDAVKRMTEIGKYQNLFVGSGTGGVGGRSHPASGEKQNLKAQAKSPQEWIKGRRDGSISLD